MFKKSGNPQQNHCPHVTYWEILEKSVRLGFKASRTEAECEALLAGLGLAQVVGADNLEPFYDSQFVEN